MRDNTFCDCGILKEPSNITDICFVNQEATCGGLMFLLPDKIVQLMGKGEVTLYYVHNK